MKPHKHFTSLQACIQHVRSKYDMEEVVCPQAKSIVSGNSITATMPRYLYRGESFIYPTTTSRMHRLKTNPKIAPEVKRVIEEVSKSVDTELQDPKFMGLPPMLSAGFCQHYGVPTELLDVTSELDVAAYFASTGCIGGRGMICVIPAALGAKKAVVIDLRSHPLAERPRRQAALAVFSKRHIDFKSNECVTELGLK